MKRTACKVGFLVWAMTCWMAAAGHAQSSPGGEIKYFRGHTTRVSSIAFSRDGRYAISGGGAQTDFFGMGRSVWMDCTARLWDVSTGKEIRKFEGHAEAITRVGISPGNTAVLTASSDDTVRIWSLQTGAAIHQFQGNLGEFSPEGKGVAVALKDGAIEVREMATGQCQVRMVGHYNGVTSLAYSPDGQSLLSGGNDEAVRIWNARTGKAVRSIRMGGGRIPLFVGFGEDAKQVVIVTDNRLSVWDAQSGRQVSAIKVAMGDSRLSFASLSADGRRMFCVERGQPVSVYEVASGARGTVFPAEVGQVSRLAVSADGKRILLGLGTSNDLVLCEIEGPPAIKRE